MIRNLMRRLERLERSAPPSWQTKLRAFARKLGVAEDELLGIVKGHERQLARSVGDDGLITWEGFKLFYNLVLQSRHDSAAPGGGQR